MPAAAQYSRRIVGWDTAERIDRILALMLLDDALQSRRVFPGLVHNSNRTANTRPTSTSSDSLEFRLSAA